MALRNLLHKNDLQAFSVWLCKKGLVIHNTKGEYEVLRAKKKGIPMLIVYRNNKESKHYTVTDRYIQTVRNFIKEKKINQ